MPKATATEINFKGVSTSGRRVHVPEGDYLLRGKSVEQTDSKSSKNPMWVFRWEFANGVKEGQEIIDRVVLVPQSMFRLRNLLEALGIKVPEGKLTVDPQKIVQITKKRPVGAQIVDDDAYEGHIPSTVKRYIPADEAEEPPAEDDDEELDEEEWEEDIDDLEEDEEDDEYEEDEEDEDEEELWTEEDLEGLSLKDLRDIAEEFEVEVKKGKKSATYIREILAAQEGEEEEDEEEEDEPEPEPPPRKRKKTAKKKATRKRTKRSTAEELEDFDLDDLE